jgi:hypothetical protein
MGSQQMRSELRQRFCRKVRPDRVILQLRAKLVSYLLVNGVDDFLTCEHGKTYRGLRRFKTNGAWPRHSLGDSGSIIFWLLSMRAPFV